MIYTLTYNPSIDYMATLDSFEVGKLNRMKKASYYYGGKGVNVSQVLKELGIDNTAMGFIAGFTGREIEEGLVKLGIKTDFVRLPEGHSRINIKLNGIDETEINAPGPRIDALSMNAMYDKLACIGRDDILVLAGTMSSNMPDDCFADLISRIPSRDTRVIVDTSGEALSNCLSYHPFLIKPNIKELNDLFHEVIVSGDIEKVTEVAQELQKMGARNVLVSMGEDGALLLTEEGKVYTRSAPAGMVVNSVGAGDSMVAGFLAGYLEKGDFEDAFIMGLCAGSATAFNEGLACGDEIMQLYRLIR